MRPALILDCDGVLVDAEQGAHLRAFNQAWRDAGVPWRWTRAEYAGMLRVSGGKERMALLRHDPRFRSVFAVPDDEGDWLELLRRWHRAKTSIYIDLLRKGEVPVRAGVRRLAQQAADRGWALAVASSGAREAVEAAVRHALGEALASVATVVAGDGVAAKKPAPDVYRQAALALGAEPSACLVIEDTEAGLAAARAAGMTCVVTPTELSVAGTFAGAAAVLSALSSSPGAPMRVLANAARLPLADAFDLRCVERWWADSSRGRAAAIQDGGRARIKRTAPAL